MKIELLSSVTTVIRTTEKYTYSIEVQCWKVVKWHLRYLNQTDCTVYETFEEAQANIRKTATLWGWDPDKTFIVKTETTTTETLHHRNKVRG